MDTNVGYCLTFLFNNCLYLSELNYKMVYNDHCIKNEVLKFDDIITADLAYKRIQDKSNPLSLRYSVIRLY